MVVLAAAAVGAIMVGNTGRSNATPLIDKPAQVYREPPAMRLTSSDRRELFNTASVFIRTAVARKHLDSAWNMLGPEMKAGQTRKSWDTGDNNVVPFPAVGIANWQVLYAYKDDVALDLGVVGDSHSDWAGKTFTIEFKRYKSQPNELARRRLGSEGRRGRRADQERCVSARRASDGRGRVRQMVARSAGVPRRARDQPGRLGHPERGQAASRREALREAPRLQLELEPVVDEIVYRMLGGSVRQE